MIDYESSLNEAQYAAATAQNGAVLVVAGAGSGKTRTVVYRLAWLAEHGVSPSSMLLLTFTRKAAQEMLHRAGMLLGQGLSGVQGGTFHSFAYSVLRRFRPAWLEGRQPTLMDSADIASAIKHCREELGLGKGDRAFPKTQSIVSLLGKARNKEVPLDEMLRRDAVHMLPYAEDLAQLDTAYRVYRRKAGLLDYDDLLFELEALLRENEEAAGVLRGCYEHILVDEYQDTNKVQARIVKLLGAAEAGGSGNVMAVGDEAQSIYAFRGADVRNILDFPMHFPGTRVIRLEENYRSVQPVLDVANALLADAPEGYRKHLFTRREGGETVRRVVPHTEKSQADVVVQRVRELLQKHLPHEIAVLFRAGYHSFQLELALNRAGIAFRKYGGLKYTEAAHVKDVIAYARLVLNSADRPSFERVCSLHKGVGEKTADKLYTLAIGGNREALYKKCARYAELEEDLRFLDSLRERELSPSSCLAALVEQYRPRLEFAYPEDWPRRLQGLEEIVQMAGGYTDLDIFLADVALETPEENAADEAEERITLSTVHSAKGLEWNAVVILDLVEDRFPSYHAASRSEDFEEERRLMYVACTRARQTLDLCVPAKLFDRRNGTETIAVPSPFMKQLPSGLCETWVETYGGRLVKRSAGGIAQPSEYENRRPNAPSFAAGGTRASFPGLQHGNADAESGASSSSQVRLGYVHHKIFGRGKALEFLPPDKMRVNFPGLGVKTILKDFLVFED